MADEPTTAAPEPAPKPAEPAAAKPAAAEAPKTAAPADAPEQQAAMTAQKTAVSVVESMVNVGAVNYALVAGGFPGVTTMNDVLTLLGVPLPPY